MRCLVGNWKMNGLSSGAEAYCAALLADESLTGSSDCHLGIAPPFTVARQPLTLNLTANSGR